MAHGGDVAPPCAAAAVGAVEDGEVLVLQVRRTLHGHGAAQGQQEGLHLSQLELALEAVHIDGVGRIKGRGEFLLHQGDLFFGPAGALEHGAGDAGRVVGDLQPAHHVALDFADLLGGVAEAGQGFGDGAVHQLEVPATRQLLELHQGKVGLDAGGVAVHEEADGACGGQHRDLGVAIAVLLSEVEGSIPALPGGFHHALGQGGAPQALGPDGQLLVLRVRGVVGRPPVVPDDAEHVLSVLGVAREGPQLARHLGAGGVGIAREDGRQGRAPLGALGAVVGDAHAHEHGAQVGVAQAQGAELVAELSDGLAGELGHQDADLEDHGPEADGVPVAHQVEPAVSREEGAEVQRREVAGRVVQEHVFGAGIAGVDGTVSRAGVPVVDGGVELDAGIGAGPGGLVDLLPEILGAELPVRLAVHPALELPVPIHFQGAHEGIGHPDGVVGVHPAHGVVALAIPAGVVAVEVPGEVALRKTAQALGEEGRGHAVPLGAGQGLAQGLVGEGIRILAGGALHGLADGVPVAAHHGATGGQHGDLALLGHLPLDEGLDVGMVQIEADHLGGAARGATALDGACSAVAHSQEAHEAGAAAATGEGLLGAAHLGEVGARAGAVLEDAGLTGPEVHDAARVHQVIGHALDEAGMGLRPLVGRGGLHHLPGAGIHVAVALGGAADAVGVVQARVEPLRGVGRAHLVGEHVGELVAEGLRILGRVEVAVGLAPVAPAAGQAVEDLPRVLLAAVLLVDALPAEIFLRQDVDGDLGPGLRNEHILGLEDHGAIQLGDPAGARNEGDTFEGIVTCLGKVAGDLHGQSWQWGLEVAMGS